MNSLKILLCKKICFLQENMFFARKRHVQKLKEFLQLVRVHYIHLVLDTYYIQLSYGVRSPKFIWAPCTQLAETPQLPPPPASGLTYGGAIGQLRQTTSFCDPLPTYNIRRHSLSPVLILYCISLHTTFTWGLKFPICATYDFFVKLNFNVQCY